MTFAITAKLIVIAAVALFAMDVAMHLLAESDRDQRLRKLYRR